MQFQKGPDIIAPADLRRVATDLANPFGQIYTPSLGLGRALQPLARTNTGHASAADAGDAENRDFFRQKIDDFQIVFQFDPRIAERARHFKRRNHAGDPVETTAIWHRIRMRAQHQRAATRLSLSTTNQVTASIDTRLKTRITKCLFHIGASLEEHRRECATRPWSVGFGDIGQSVDICRDTAGIDDEIGSHMA
ncbi:hypothetical protein D3C71_1660780 [compost metagenome]